jgi:uncharacterized protein (DUF1015 family)
MANIAPFRAHRFDPARAPLSDVVTQPYDKITPEMQDRYYNVSPYNLVRIILGKEDSSHPQKDRYLRAADYYSQWRREGVFLHDKHPSLYRYVQTFISPNGKTELQRSGFVTLGQIEDYSAKIVFRHEQTLAKPKADRLDLLRATRAHFGQIFMLYSDSRGEVEAALASENGPDVELRDEYGVLHQLWQVNDPDVIELVRSKMQDKKLIIADGHHRYETALTYRNERRAAELTSVTRDVNEHAKENKLHQHKLQQLPSYEMVMMTCVNMESPGLVILPTHRVVHGLDSFSAEILCEKARAYFSVEEVDPAISATRATGLLREAGHAGTAILGITSNRAFLFDTPKTFGSNLFAGASLRQQSLDVVQLHKCLLENVLGISEEAIRDQQNVSYIRDAEEALSRVRDGSANVAFLMNPVRMQQMRDIAFAGEVLPQKSTDFYPKLLSGLTVYALD